MKTERIGERVEACRTPLLLEKDEKIKLSTATYVVLADSKPGMSSQKKKKKCK